MDNSRMSNADMIQYCDEALAWEEFGPVDIFFFESVKKILLGQCSPIEEPDDVIDDLMGIERPVTDDELAPDYDKYADDYYDGEEVQQEEDEAVTDEETAFTEKIFTEGFFNAPEETAGNADATADTENSEGYTVNV